MIWLLFYQCFDFKTRNQAFKLNQLIINEICWNALMTHQDHFISAKIFEKANMSNSIESIICYLFSF